MPSCSESDDKDDTSPVFVFGNDIEASSHTLSQGLKAILNVQQPPYTAFVYLLRRIHHPTVTSITAESDFSEDFYFVVLHDNQHIVNNVKHGYDIIYQSFHVVNESSWSWMLTFLSCSKPSRL